MPPDQKRPTYLFVLQWTLARDAGVNQVVINLARQMQTSGSFDPVVLVTDWNAAEPVWQEVHGIKTVRWLVRPYSSSHGMKERIAYSLWERKFRPAFARFCDEQKVGVINAHYPGLSAATLERCTNGGKRVIPHILSFHGADVNGIREEGSVSIAEWRQFLSRATATVACSNDLAKKISGVFGKKIVPHVVHNGINADAFVALASASKIAGRRNILNVGTFEEKKGQDTLVRAFSMVASEFPDVDLVLVGATSAALLGLRRLCVDERIADRVQFFPDTPHHEVAEFFRQASIFALPSRQEPFGIVLLEAGAFGLPVVASKVGGIPEILTEGATGRLVAPDRPDELANCLRALLAETTSSEQMGARLRQRVLSDFTWVAAHEKYLALVPPEVTLRT